MSSPPAAPDDDTLLAAIAEHMARIDPRSARGAPVLVAELRPGLTPLFPDKAAFDAALLRLERSARLTLIRHDPALPAAGADESHFVLDGSVLFMGVALR